MGICTRRHFLLTVCTLQLVSTVERQVFDFLGYMWAPILANFFHIIFVIFGFFGTFQYRPKYIITYTVWCILWLGWNVFVICFYLSIGVLDKDSDILNLGTGSVSWWEVNGAGCKPTYPTNLTLEADPDPARPPRPERVTGCFLDYQYVEVLHAALQCLLAVLGSASGISVTHVFLEEDDSFDFLDGFEAKSPQHLALRPMYVHSYAPVPSQHAKQHYHSPSKLTQSPSSQSKTAPLQLRGTDKIRLYSSDSCMNTWSSGPKEHPLAVAHKQMPSKQPRPKSLYSPRQNSEYV